MMEGKLPKNWVETTFMSIFDIQGGTQPPKKHFIYEPRDNYIRLLQIRDFGLKPHPTFIPKKPNLRICSVDDILIARYGASIGRILTGMNGAYNVAIAKVLIPNMIEKRFVFWLLKSGIFQNFILSLQRTAQNGFNKNDLKNILLPLPPLPEQKRIVAKLDILMGQVEQLRAGLERVPALLRDFRQSVLTRAVTGEMTLAFKKKNNLPDWEKTSLGSISNLVTSGSRGWAKYYSDIGAIFVRAQNINKDYLDLSDVAFVSLKNEREGIRSRLGRNDLLITITGANVTKTAIVDYKISEAYVSQHVSLLRLKNPDFASFVYFYLICETHGRKQLIDFAYGQGKPQLNLTNIKNVELSIPSIDEQSEIVRRIKSLFAKADAIQARYERLKEKIDHLPQAILAKAFRGELVEQLPGDGDARDLLVEIGKARAELETKKRTKGKKKVDTHH